MKATNHEGVHDPHPQTIGTPQPPGSRPPALAALAGLAAAWLLGGCLECRGGSACKHAPRFVGVRLALQAGPPHAG